MSIRLIAGITTIALAGCCGELSDLEASIIQQTMRHSVELEGKDEEISDLKGRRDTLRVLARDSASSYIRSSRSRRIGSVVRVEKHDRVHYALLALQVDLPHGQELHVVRDGRYVARMILSVRDGMTRSTIDLRWLSVDPKGVLPDDEVRIISD